MLLKHDIPDRSARAAIALGDISDHTRTRYKYYCMAVKWEPRNVEAISHAALEAARLGLDKAAQSLVHRALKVGFTGYRPIKDVLLHDLFIAAALVDNNRTKNQVKVLFKNTEQYGAEIQKELCWRNVRLRRKY